MNVRKVSRFLRPDRGAAALFRALRQVAVIDDIVVDLYDPRRGGRRGGSAGKRRPRRRLERVHLRRSEVDGGAVSESWTVMKREPPQEPAPGRQIEGETVETPSLLPRPTDEDEDGRPS